MTKFMSLISFVSAAFFLVNTISDVAAVPLSASVNHYEHRTRNVGSKRATGVSSFYPSASYETFGAGKDLPSFKSDEDKAVAFVKDQHSGFKYLDVRRQSGFTSKDGVEHAYLKQYYNGVPVINTAANVAFKDGKAVTFGSSFVDVGSLDMPSTEPAKGFDSIVDGTLRRLDGSLNKSIQPSLGIYLSSSGSPSLVYAAQVKNDESFTWYEAYISASSGDLVSVSDFVTDLSYKVVPITEAALPDGLETVEDPENLDASPNGWVTNGTSGNNVVSYKLLTPLTSPAPFDYTYDDSRSPLDLQNVDASRVNAFYLINSLHDIWYEYGFTEQAFNFQNDNFGKGGEGGDRVRMSVQDASGTNNANFATPPDGQPGQCRMYIWTETTPNRDGTMDNSIPVHEYTHGLTNRMTGGGTGSCLQTDEAGGMGEGWSDAMAEWTQLTSDKVEDFVLGVYATGDPKGIRSVPYSTDKSVDPLMYSTIKTLNEVHDIGEVWATVLHGVLATLVSEYGFSEDRFTSSSGDAGNVVYANLFLDALALQPCNPTMPQAREAWIQADENKYRGEHVCSLWKAFAYRGLGVGAANYTDSAVLPDEC